MDDRLEKALEHANYRSTIELQRRNMELKFQNDLLHSQDGGTFSANRELIAFIDYLIRDGQVDAVIVDAKSKPVLVSDLPAFLAALTSAYYSATNRFYSDFEKLRKARSVKLATGL